MSIPEAAQLVLQAAAVGASGQVLVLDMGEPVKIIDLARSLIRLAGHAPEEIAIEFTGLRPGEKMFEELLAAADDAVATEVPRLRVARLAEAPLGPLRELLAGLDGTGGMSGEPPLDDDAVRRRLQAAVPEYRAAGLKPQATARAG
jgi:FlaA1/EpsC-like NDP-sugar epimerase